MRIFGNLFLFIAIVVFVSILSGLYRKNIPVGGDAAMSYVWGIIFMHFALLICLSAVLISIAISGGFYWISEKMAIRYFSAFGVLFIAVLAAALASLFKNENGPVLAVLKFLSGFPPIIIPLMLIINAFLLLNQDVLFKISPSTFKYFNFFITGYSGLIIFLTLASYAKESAKNSMAVARQEETDYNENISRMLGEIDTCDVSKNMVFILVFSDANQSDIVREKALAKIKTNSKWQEELLRLLETDWAPEAFNFLASNEVENKEMFYVPLQKGIIIQARLIRENIQRCSHASHDR